MGSQSFTQTKTILLAEDYDELRAVLIAVLESPGVRVISASNGREALQKADAHDGSIDLLLTDLDMGEVGGIELAWLLNQDRPELKVLLMSGGGAPNELGRGWEFLGKPFNASILIEKIDALMN